jgi:hypothetical protein
VGNVYETFAAVVAVDVTAEDQVFPTVAVEIDESGV